MNPHAEHDAFNAVKLAKTPVADALMAAHPWTLVKTSGEDVGLPEGTMGNSEVGHQNIGAGRIVDQESVAITKACRAGLASGATRNATICEAIAGVVSRGGTLHLLGIASDAGVHGQLEHLYAIVRCAKELGCKHVAVHLFTDGRDTGPFTGKGYVAQVEAELAKIGLGSVASLSGRYYAMDRDNRWERVQLAYDVLTGRSAGASFGSAQQAIEDYYAKPTSASMSGDEFVTPRVVVGAGQQRVIIRDGDAVVFFNYRGDRPREISAAFVFPDDKWARVKASPDSGRAGFDRGAKLRIDYVIMTEYWEELLPFVKVAFPKPPKMVNIGGEWLAKKGLRQFRCAETEKYPHVTFFFNDYRDEPFAGEVRNNPQSPKVATYDEAPAMSAGAIGEAVLARLAAKDCEDVLIVNFANGDMVGHTGKLDAAIRACEVVDALVGKIVEATLARGGAAVVTADHGNAEQMWDPATNAPHTAHTTYDVPLIVASAESKGMRLRGDRDVRGWFDAGVRARRGCLGDIFPTVLELLGVEQPAEMTGRSLIVR
jgi:2,3-bisphosphoglycerate-independent phosphoglycerate mutase